MPEPETDTPDPEALEEQPPEASTIEQLRSWRPQIYGLRGLRDLWQIPTVLAAAAILLLGVRSWVGSTEPPDFAQALDTVERRLDRQEYDAAAEILNGPLRESVDLETTPTDVLARFFALRADTMFLSQREQGTDLAQNNLRIVENYQVAERNDPGIIDQARATRIAETMFALDRVNDALAWLGRVADPTFAPRKRLIQRIIDAGLSSSAPAAARARAVDLLAAFRNEPTATDTDRLWSIVRQSRMSLNAGFAEDAIRRILPELQRVESVDSPEAGELFVLLGRAYLEMGHLDDARRRLTHAETVIPEADINSARTQVLLAQVDRVEEDPESARDRLAAVTARFPETDAALDAWIGLGEVEAALGSYPQSVNAFEQAVFTLARQPEADPDRVEAASSAMAQRHRERFAREDYETALRFAALAARLYDARRTPPDVIVRQADTHRARAEQLLVDAPRTHTGAVDVFETDPATLEQARQHYAKAGDHFAEHARATLLGDPETSAQSLWFAADSKDHAGDIDEAVKLFSEYVEIRHDDERRLEGVFRLARAHQARGNYQSAIELYELMLADHPTSEVAYASYVPLAQCYLLASADADLERAEQLLTKVLSGDVFTPDAPEYRQALLELGRMYRSVGAHTQAIQQLEEARDRYPDLAVQPDFLANLADAHRLAASELGAELQRAMPASQRKRLGKLRVERLEKGLELYEQSRVLLAEIPKARQTELHKVMLRNAMLYRGDCAYDLGQLAIRRPEQAREWFEQAIRFYDTAAQRYPDDPASLVAMIQIVNCYAALEKWREVRTAHERARARLAELPDEAFEESETPMDRRYWERWLDAAIELDRVADASDAP